MSKEYKMIIFIMFSLMIFPISMLYVDDSWGTDIYNNGLPFFLISSALLLVSCLGLYVLHRSLVNVVKSINSAIRSIDVYCYQPLVIKTRFALVNDLISSINDLMLHYIKEVEIATDKHYIDSSTFLPNKLWLNERCEHVRFSALILVQVESVSSVAESLKFDEYEAFMCSVSNELSAIAGEDTVIVRVDSDKYALGLNSEIIIDYVMGKIRALENRTFDICSHSIYVEFLFGTSSVTQGCEASASSLLDDAKLALYEARRNKTKHAHFDNAMRLNSNEKIHAYNKLKQAVANDEFIPYFQPIVCLDSGDIVGAEALARWNDPERGIVGPYAFIELAEDTGLIDSIGLSILTQSLNWYRDNQHVIPNRSNFRIHVNISIRQLMNANFVDDVKQIMNDFASVHPNVCFEFTESIYMESQQVIDNLVELRTMGISFSIDDFGTGYSSFSYLRDIDFSSLKIDKSFVSEESAEILKAMISMGRSLGCEVIAEGVETPEQCAILKSLNCPMVQGYLFSKPLPKDEFIMFMRAHQGNAMMALC